MRWLALLCLMTATLNAQPKRVLYVTHSAGFRHSCLPLSEQVMRGIARETGVIDLVATDQLTLLEPDSLRTFDAVFFYTSGELPLTEAQSAALLQFVRDGKGFGGTHSATDTFYQWPEYGELIGARFNGHPWVQPVRIDIEDPDHPATQPLGRQFEIREEIYQFREFSRARSRVLMTLDPLSVDLSARNVNPNTEDFPLAWTHSYGRGRVFYTALGHFENTWEDRRFQAMLRGALLWLAGLQAGDGAVRPPATPFVHPDGVGNAASLSPRMALSAGSIFSIYGRNLSTGSAMSADARGGALRLAGTTVRVNGRAIPLFYASPGQINGYLHLETETPPSGRWEIEVSTGDGGPASRQRLDVGVRRATPGIFASTYSGRVLTLWATGLGAVTQRGDLSYTNLTPVVNLAGSSLPVLFSGLAPGWRGLYQVNVQLPASIAHPARVTFELDGESIPFFLDPSL